MLLLPGETIKVSSKSLHKKLEGTLYFTNKRLVWCKKDEQTPTVEIAHEAIHSPRVNKSDTKVMLKVITIEPGTANEPSETKAPVFNWNQENKAEANEERTKFVTELSILTTRRTQAAASGQKAAAPTSSQNTASSEYAKLKIGAAPASADEIKLRQEVLSKNGDLAKVHKSLVISGLVSEDEFWSTRKHILETYAIQSQLRKGESSAWLGLESQNLETGNFKYTITPNVARRIFKEYPQVKRAYVDNVPHVVSEKEFWKRFVASQFFNRGRSADAVKGRDKIFDKCVQEEDSAFNDTKRINLAFLTRLLDLTRTEEDATETGNAPDFTMRPSRTDSKLALIRRFNHHSQLVLQTVLNSKRKQLASDHNSTDKMLEEATVLEDLDIAQPEKKIKLNVKDRSRYFSSLAADDAGKQSKKRALDPSEVRAALAISFDISRPLDGCGNTQKTMATLSQATHRLALQKRPNRIQELQIPDDINIAVAECHGAGTEMLRHLWAILRMPPSPERRQKAEKIVAAFDNVDRHVRKTIAGASSAETKNPKLSAMIEKMLQPTLESLRVGRKSFESYIKAA
ncbi:RNA polymerase II transcription factor B subunit 1 [Coemansia sp. RSA 2336]|nr:RNA polymerase II transcription factor B subunit 1 [Coemansia sp. RSA 2336]